MCCSDSAPPAVSDGEGEEASEGEGLRTTGHDNSEGCSEVVTAGGTGFPERGVIVQSSCVIGVGRVTIPVCPLTVD